LKGFAAMRACHPQEQRWFADCDETDPMMNRNQTKGESIRGLFGDSLQLVFCHFTMRIVIDALDFAAIFHWPDYAVEINDRARASDITFGGSERPFCH
jgi:hypothetical protein